jgi:hypothetical protein
MSNLQVCRTWSKHTQRSLLFFFSLFLYLGTSSQYQRTSIASMGKQYSNLCCVLDGETANHDTRNAHTVFNNDCSHGLGEITKKDTRADPQGHG